jgi:aspartate dehydrogenase
VQIATTKNPKSLGRNDSKKCVVFEGSVRQAAKLMPRNVNVHAALALAGIGFDQTQSVIISDPDTKENTHLITASNADTTIEIVVRSNPIGAVTGAYTPISAYGSVKRALRIADKNMSIV